MEEAAPRTDIVVANELDEYSSSFGYRTVRLGLGTGPNIHRVTRLRGIDLQSGTIGIPNVGEKTIGDDQFLVALCARSRGGSRWSEHAAGSARSGAVAVGDR